MPRRFRVTTSPSSARRIETLFRTGKLERVESLRRDDDVLANRPIGLTPEAIIVVTFFVNVASDLTAGLVKEYLLREARGDSSERPLSVTRVDEDDD